MGRFVSQDYSRLHDFLNDYSLSDVLQSKTREALIKRGHKNCLTALQIWAIADKLAKEGALQLNGVNVTLPAPQLDLIAECFSDITSAFFAALHGLYKPAHMSLRSAIETFTRGVSGLSNNEAMVTTSVYRLFELACDCEPFSKSAASYFTILHDQYRQLCAITHTAAPVHMVRNHALANFPKQEIEPLRRWCRHFESITIAIVSVLMLANRQLYLKAHIQVQDLYDEMIPKEVRLFALRAPTK